MRVVLDASVLVARFVPADEFHDDGLCVVRAGDKKEFTAIAPAILPAALAGAVARKTGDTNLADVALLHLGTYAGLTIRTADTAFIEKAARLAARHALRGADAFYLAVAAEQKCPLITLDGELLTRAPSSVKVLRPAEWLATLRR